MYHLPIALFYHLLYYRGMSDQSVTDLMELAQFHRDYWSGEGIGAVIEADIARGDLEALNAHVLESAKIIYDLEYNPAEALIGENDVY